MPGKMLQLFPERVTPGAGNLVLSAKQGVFSTLQGEGLFVGMPSLFIRLYGCNLTCEHCDTKFTWHPEKARDLYAHLEIKSFARAVHSYGISHIVITGGEPALQAEGLVDFLYELNKLSNGHVVTLETNGTVFNTALADVVDLVSLSPKLAVVRKEEGFSINSALADWLLYCNDVNKTMQIKVVFSDDDELDEAITFVSQLVERGYIEPEHCFLQPEWCAYGVRPRTLLDKVVKAGLRWGGQIHKVWIVE